jgi:hypothetical protein
MKAHIPSKACLGLLVMVGCVDPDAGDDELAVDPDANTSESQAEIAVGQTVRFQNQKTGLCLGRAGTLVLAQPCASVANQRWTLNLVRYYLGGTLSAMPILVNGGGGCLTIKGRVPSATQILPCSWTGPFYPQLVYHSTGTWNRLQTFDGCINAKAENQACTTGAGQRWTPLPL